MSSHIEYLNFSDELICWEQINLNWFEIILFEIIYNHVYIYVNIYNSYFYALMHWCLKDVPKNQVHIFYSKTGS